MIKLLLGPFPGWLHCHCYMEECVQDHLGAVWTTFIIFLLNCKNTPRATTCFGPLQLSMLGVPKKFPSLRALPLCICVPCWGNGHLLHPQTLVNKWLAPTELLLGLEGNWFVFPAHNLHPDYLLSLKFYYSISYLGAESLHHHLLTEGMHTLTMWCASLTQPGTHSS